MPKRSRSGLVRSPARVVAPTSVNRDKIDLHRARRRPLADDEIELEILHRRIEDFLDRRIEPVDFVDEEHVALLEIGQQRREIAGLGDHGAGGGAEIHAELAREDLRQRGLAEAGRADEQHVIERLAALARGADEDVEIGARLFLADEFVELLRTQRCASAISSSRRSGETMRRGCAQPNPSFGAPTVLVRQQFGDGRDHGSAPFGTMTRAFGS